jgi:hypothetical protein
LSLKKVSDTKFREQYQVKISNRFTALESLDVNVDISRAWEGFRGYCRISARDIPTN